MNKLSNYLAAAAISTALTFAQGPGGPLLGTPPDPATRIQMRVSFLSAHLSLTDDQKTQATTIFTNAFAAAQNAVSSLQADRQSLSDAVKTNNSATIDQVSASMGALNGQVTAINAKADAAFYAILTPDQKTKYDAAPHGGPGGGPGAMGAGFGRDGGPRNRAHQ